VHVKVDEDLPKAAVEILVRRGYAATSVVEQQLGGSKDPSLWSAVQAEQQFFVTADKGFGDIRAYPPGEHAGILLLRPHEAGIRPVIELLERTLAVHDLEELAGAVAVVTPRGIRVRRARA
jgi:predicted nuclease of predicted toxin-antitoxin system